MNNILRVYFFPIQSPLTVTNLSHLQISPLPSSQLGTKCMFSTSIKVCMTMLSTAISIKMLWWHSEAAQPGG